jgi:hypothetical protein
MGMTMIDKKDPNQKIIEDDFFDDDPIIELTDEVIIKPEEDRKAASLKTDDFMPPKKDQDLSFADDEDIIVFDENAKLSMQNDPFTEAEGQITDDAIEMTGDKTRNNFDDNIELEYENDEEEIDFFAEDDEQSEDNSVIAMPSEISPTLGEDDNGIDMLADIEFEGEEIIALDELDKVDVEPDDDIIEITEFDQHFPDDDDEALEHAGYSDPSGLKDEDFLELFDIEEEGPLKDEEVRTLSESEEKAVEAELSRFFDDALENETGIENKVPQPTEKFSKLDTNLDLVMAAAALSSGGRKIERPNTPSLQDPATEKELTSFPKDKSGKDEQMKTYSPESKAGDYPVASPEQIDQAVERIVNEKLAGRIEHIIYEIIEKAVKREIDQLKESLFEDGAPEDDF